jgi:glycine/D-amino acid oxidase-like deaminating enzyme/CRP-like cAMP-binding protein
VKTYPTALHKEHSNGGVHPGKEVSRVVALNGLRSLLAISGRLDAARVKHIAAQIKAISPAGQPASKKLRLVLQAIDRKCEFSPQGLAIFQDLLAALAIPTFRPILLPLDDRPFWARWTNPLTDYQSRSTLRARADILIIGAGLTGASAAYHLADAAKQGRRIVVIEQLSAPASESSGRNGGNFELLPENSVAAYEGLANERLGFLRRSFPRLPVEIVQAVGERHASLVLGIAVRNRDLLKGIILREGIACDFSPRGWLHLANSDKEEQGICEEVSFAAQRGQRIELWSRRKIQHEFGIQSDYLGRFIPGDGTYHPVKYVCGLLQRALESGVELYTSVSAKKIISVAPGRHLVITNEGTIIARRVIAASNAFTPRLFPELKRMTPRQSQILITEHAPDRTHGRIGTSEEGPVYFNQPRAGARDGLAPLLMGGGHDRPTKNPFSRRRSPAVHARLLEVRDRFYPELKRQPPSTEWVGTMAFTPDELPCVGFLRPGVIVAAAFNGYGGSYTTASGLAAALMAKTDKAIEWAPEDVFSPKRLLSSNPLFLSNTVSLWQIAASLCDQLKFINRQIYEAVGFTSHSAPSRTGSKPRSKIGRPTLSRIASVDPTLLKNLEVFADFTQSELQALLRITRPWHVTGGTILFREGGPGGSCFAVIRGVVEVTFQARGRSQSLAKLPPGSIFGQMSLITKEPRTATCACPVDSLLLEIKRKPCEQLLKGRSKLALKLLAALTQGLISALRGANRQLMQLESAPHHDSHF